MKAFATLILAVTLGFTIQAQMPVAPNPDMAALLALKAMNESLLKQQEATVATLEELKLTATQLKIYTKRG